MLKRYHSIGVGVGFAILFILLGFLPLSASAAELWLSPSAKEISTGDTFEVDINIDTEDEAINAFDIQLKFPPSLLQVVSTGSGSSVVGVWIDQPSFNNVTGEIHLAGGIPRGINTDQARVASFIFRGRGIGNAVVEFIDERSSVLRHDGQGTEILERTQPGRYTVSLPPPQGPTVTSPTHVDQSTWHPFSEVALEWEKGSYQEFSYTLDQNPQTIPDRISEGAQTSVTYNDLRDGQHYFHIRALRAGKWGGTTHFAINIDTTMPAEFTPQVILTNREIPAQPVVQFYTTDAHSRINHYEVNLVSLSRPGDNQSIFVEATSPHILPRITREGAYEVIVRAYDNAGNVRTAKSKIRFGEAVYLDFVTEDGLHIGSITISWGWLLGGLIALTLLVGYFAGRARRLHKSLKGAGKDKPPTFTEERRRRLKELKDKHSGNIALLLLVVGALAFFPLSVGAQVSTPIIQEVSSNITEKDIFYVGGLAPSANSDVLLHLQNKRTGETKSFNIETNNQGSWFYQHDIFLSPGKYIVWAQSLRGDEVSAPSSRRDISVEAVAFTIGNIPIGSTTFYTGIVLILLLIIFLLGGYAIYYGIRAHRRFAKIRNHIRAHEQAISHEFAILRRDLERDLEHLIAGKKHLSAEDRERKEMLEEDIKTLKKEIDDNTWDIVRSLR